MKKVLLTFLGCAVLACCNGCATKYVEAKALKYAVEVKGYRISDADPTILRAPAGSSALGMNSSQAAWDFYPFQYLFANLVDYGVIPSATIGAGIYLADHVNGSDGGSTTYNYNYDNQGDVNNVNGDGNTLTSDQSVTEGGAQ